MPLKWVFSSFTFILVIMVISFLYSVNKDDLVNNTNSNSVMKLNLNWCW